MPFTKGKFYYSCNGQDQKYGCYSADSADWEGYCEKMFGSKHGCKTKESARQAALRHEKVCRFKGKTQVFKINGWGKRKYLPIIGEFI
jgi:hypothetical protein